MCLPSRAFASLLLAASVVTCSESPTSARRSSVALAFVPQFSAQQQAIFRNLAAFAVTLDNVHVVVRSVVGGDALGSILKDTTVSFPATANQISIELELQIDGPQQTVLATVDLQSGSTPYFEGTQSIVAKVGETATAPTPVAMSYVGPGATATSLTIFPISSNQPITLAPLSSATFNAQASDQSGRGVVGLPVAWSTSDPTIATATADGIVTATGKAGSTTLIATGLNGATGQTTIDVQPAVQLAVASGDNQTGIAGTKLSAGITVEAIAANGHLVSGATISFTTLNGAGSVSPASATTSVGGLATATLTLGQAIGTYTLIATLAGSSASLRVTANATAAAAAALGILTGNNQSDTVRATLGQPLAVKVTDSFGNPVAKQPIDFTIAAGRALLLPAAGAVGQTIVHTATDDAGTAQVLLVADTLAGAVSVTASAPQTSLASVTFIATVKSGVAAKLTLLQQPSITAQATLPLGVQPKVQVADQFGNAVAAAGLSISVSPAVDCTRVACGRIVPPGASGPSLTRMPIPTAIARTQSISDTFPRGIGGATQVKTNPNGIAEFSDLTLNLSTGPWQLVFTDTTAGVPLSSVTSNDIQLSPGPIASIVAWPPGTDTTQVSILGATLSPSVKVIDKVGNGIAGVPIAWQVLDSLGSRLPDSTNTVTDASGVANPGRWVTPLVVGLLTFTIQATPAPTPPQKIENAPLSLNAISSLP